LGVSTCIIGRRQKNSTEEDLCCREDDEKSSDHAALSRQRVNTFGNPFSQDQSLELNDQDLPDNQEYLGDERRPNEKDERDDRCPFASGELSGC